MGLKRCSVDLTNELMRGSDMKACRGSIPDLRWELEGSIQR